MPDDATLLRDYAENHSEKAFAELVRRHLNLVYSAALRKTRGDVHRAQDISQSVFTDLARKAGPLSRRNTLAGWLYLSTHHAAAELMRREQRRQAREQAAHTMQEISHDPTPAIDWEKVHPVLDEIIRQLNDLDREAVLLRFFEQRPFAEIGTVLQLNEDAARKRVDRALEKLRSQLATRGITSTIGALGAVLAANSAVAAPPELALQVSTGAIAAGTTSGKVATSLPALLASHVKAGIFGIALLAGAAAVVVQQSSDTEQSSAAPDPATFAPAADATTRAIVVIGLTADPAQSRRLHEQADLARRGFIARGIAASSIQFLSPAAGAPVTRDVLLAAIRDTNALRRETWILLLGHAAKNRDGHPAYQVSGPRLSPDDLAAAIGTLPGKKFVVVSTALSGGFLPPLLALPDVEAVAATADSGEINEPRFGGAWASALVAHPKASFGELAASAAKNVEKFYREKSLGQGEHARLIDRANHTILDAPFTHSSPSSPPSAAR